MLGNIKLYVAINTLAVCLLLSVVGIANGLPALAGYILISLVNVFIASQYKKIHTIKDAKQSLNKFYKLQVIKFLLMTVAMLLLFGLVPTGQLKFVLYGVVASIIINMLHLVSRGRNES